MFKNSKDDGMECILKPDINAALNNSIKYLKPIIKENNQFNG